MCSRKCAAVMVVPTSAATKDIIKICIFVSDFVFATKAMTQKSEDYIRTMIAIEMAPIGGALL